MSKHDLLLSKGFDLEEYADGYFYAIIVTADSVGRDRIDKICSAFGVPFKEDIYDISIQCPEDFSRCIFFVDDDQIEMDLETFWNGIENM